MRPATIALVGDHDAAVTAHRAIPPSLEHAARELGVPVRHEWVATEEIHAPRDLERFAGLWCVPATPYRSMEGALCAIRWSREGSAPFLATCGGFQHALIEFARNVLGWTDAEHGESAPDATRQVVSALECSLVETSERVHLNPGSRLAAAYGVNDIVEGYRCRYGLNPQFRETLLAGPLRAAAEDASGEVRAVELDGHPFFVATLFQPERAILSGAPSPIVRAFVQAVATGASSLPFSGVDPS